MAYTVNVYKGDEKVGSGPSPVHVVLPPGEYPAGTFKGSFSDETGNESAKKDFPAVSVPEPVVAVTGVTISPNTDTVEMGKTATFTQTIAPTNATDLSGKWSTSDTSLATIANGVVTPKAVGEVDVTFTTNDGGKAGSAHLVITAATE